MTQNWRARVDAQDHFGQQKRISEIEQRRPVIRRPADLGLGPGIGASAVKITNWNDLLAQYDGYYSSVIGAFGAPSDTEPFVGFVVNDSTLGGVQQATGLVSGNHYRRVFRRNPSDARSVSFGAWVWTNPPAAAQPGVESFANGDGSNKITAVGSSWRLDSWNLERWGRQAMIRVSLTYRGALDTMTNIDHPNKHMATIQDVNWRPMWRTGTLTYAGFRAVSVSDAGAIELTGGLSDTEYTNSNIEYDDIFVFGMSYLLPKNVV